MRSLQAFSPRPTRKAAVPPPDRWQKQSRTVCNISRRRISGLSLPICEQLQRKQVTDGKRDAARINQCDERVEGAAQLSRARLLN